MSGSRYGRTPSGWHDDASRRDAGHDEMQAAQLRFWRSADSVPSIERDVHGSTYGFFFRHVEAEYPFRDSRSGRLSGFADLVLRFETEESSQREVKRGIVTSYEPLVWHAFLELKPRIVSVGAVIRQCKATALLARRNAGLSGVHNFDVWAVVYEGDPKADILCEMYDDGPVIRLPRPRAGAEP